MNFLAFVQSCWLVLYSHWLSSLSRYWIAFSSSLADYCFGYFGRGAEHQKTSCSCCVLRFHCLQRWPSFSWKRLTELSCYFTFIVDFEFDIVIVAICSRMNGLWDAHLQFAFGRHRCCTFCSLSGQQCLERCLSSIFNKNEIVWRIIDLPIIHFFLCYYSKPLLFGNDLSSYCSVRCWHFQLCTFLDRRFGCHLAWVWFSSATRSDRFMSAYFLSSLDASSPTTCSASLASSGPVSLSFLSFSYPAMTECSAAAPTKCLYCSTSSVFTHSFARPWSAIRRCWRTKLSCNATVDLHRVVGFDVGGQLIWLCSNLTDYSDEATAIWSNSSEVQTRLSVSMNHRSCVGCWNTWLLWPTFSWCFYFHLNWHFLVDSIQQDFVWSYHLFEIQGLC